MVSKMGLKCKNPEEKVIVLDTLVWRSHFGKTELAATERKNVQIMCFLSCMRARNQLSVCDEISREEVGWAEA